MKPDIEICVTCWKYSRLLCYQLSSLLLHRPQCQVLMTVCLTPDDIRTVDMVNWFMMPPNQSSTVTIRRLSFSRNMLMTRAIARNVVALTTEARVVWFADCDMPFGENCLDTLAEAETKYEQLYYVRAVRKCPHEHGDTLIDAVKAPGIMKIDAEPFRPVKHGYALGGMQIVTGDTARLRGYLNGRSRYHGGGEPPVNNKSDVGFRKSLGGNGSPLVLPNAFRICHSKCGRLNLGVEL